MWSRILSNTFKHIRRSGWVGIGSIVVMTLAFLVVSIFGGLAYVSNLYIQFIERKSNILVFFEVGMDSDVIDELETKWRAYPQIKDINFTSEDEAFDLYADYTSKVNTQTYAVLQEQEQQKLPSSLDIQIWSLDDLSTVQSQVQKDIELKLKDLEIIDTTTETETNETITETTEQTTDIPTSDTTTPEQEDALDTSETLYMYSQDPTQPPILLKVDSENLEELKDVLFALRIAGIFVISLLLTVIFIFIFMISEFRLYNQKEEIGVMQLVGGSLFYIRAPYILEGGFYGLLGAALSSGIIGSILATVFIFQKDSTITKYFYKNFDKLPWPDLTYFHWIGLFLLLSLIGAILGSLSSYLSIRRYIR